MGAYLLMTFLSIALGCISMYIKKADYLKSDNKRRVGAYVFAILSFLPLTIIMAIRYDVGTDFWSYYNIFKHQNSDNLEVGFVWFNSFLYNFSHNPQIFFIVTSVIICASYFIAIYRESINPAYSILLFVIVMDYFISMNVIRQYLANSIILFAIPYIKRNEYLKVALCIFIAMLFHKSAIIIVFLIILFKLNIKPVIGIAITAACYSFSSLIMSHFLDVLQSANFYINYFGSSLFGNMDEVFNWQKMLIVSGPFILLCCIYKKVNKNENLRLLYASTLMSVALLAMSASLPTIITRMTWYMNAFIVLYLPQAISQVENRTVRRALNVVIILLFSIVAVRNIVGGAQNVLPYKIF